MQFFFLCKKYTIKHQATNPMIWDTCLCRTCLNPEIKLEKLSKTEKDWSLDLVEDSTDEDVRQIMYTLCQIKANKGGTIEYVEW